MTSDGASRHGSPSRTRVRRREPRRGTRISVRMGTQYLKSRSRSGLLLAGLGDRGERSLGHRHGSGSIFVIVRRCSSDRSDEPARLGDLERLTDAALDAVAELRVVAQVVLRGLAALSEALLAAREPRAGLGDDAFLDTEVEQRTLLGDALAVHEVELGLAERRSHLVLDDLGAHPVADDVGPLLDRIDATDVDADRCVELQRAAAGGGLRAAEHDADLLAQLV